MGVGVAVHRGDTWLLSLPVFLYKRCFGYAGAVVQHVVNLNLL